VSVVPQPEKSPRLTVLPLNEAIRQARPLPSDDDMAIEDLTDDEWQAFQKALTER
jgi:hypothetical protein